MNRKKRKEQKLRDKGTWCKRSTKPIPQPPPEGYIGIILGYWTEGER